MSHFGASAMIDAWRETAGGGRMPRRADFDPMRLAPVAPLLWSADRTAQQVRLRLAGAKVEALHGRPLAGLDWLDLFSTDSRSVAAEAVDLIFREGRPRILSAAAPLCPRPFDIVLTPMRDRRGHPTRIVGLYDLGAEAARIEAAGLLTVTASTGVGEPTAPAFLALASVDGRRIA